MGSEHGQFFLLEALISEIKFNVADILEQAEVHLDKIHLESRATQSVTRSFQSR